jgi:hypothetical protein
MKEVSTLSQQDLEKVLHAARTITYPAEPPPYF